MYFIGAGALLYKAVVYAHQVGYAVDGIFLPCGDTVSKRLSRLGLSVVESNSPEDELPAIFAALSGNVVFSINNNYLLPDSLLKADPRVFNIHNGLVQDYRGKAEVCLFAAICRGDKHYGATLHELLPAQNVDAGPVLNQSRFEILENETFGEAIKKSLDNCQTLFELSLDGIMDGSLVPTKIMVAPNAYSYRNIDAIGSVAHPHRLAKASNLGAYSGFFPKLRMAILAHSSGQYSSSSNT